MADATRNTREIEQRILGEIWTSGDIMESLRYLCDDLGSRFGGTESEHQAAEYLRDKMVEYGLQNVHLEKFPVYTWERGACELTLTAPLERTISAIAMPFCPAGEFTGEVIDVGEGETADFERMGDAVRGKIVLSAAETNKPGQVALHRTDKYRLAHEAGAIGYIMANKNPGLLHITGGLYARKPNGPDDIDHDGPIPAIGISHEAAELLRRLGERGTLQVRIRQESRTWRSHSFNVIGDIPGGEAPNEILLFGGHYDGHDIAQGAADDAAGTLVGLEIGRRLAPYAGQLKRTIRIICFGYEELGLGGSWKHADRYDSGDETLVFVMNLDGAGRGQGGQEKITTTGDPELANWFRTLPAQLLYDFEIANRISAHSDHFPFFLKGYPSASLNSADSTAGMIGRGYGHTEGDTVDKVYLRGLQMGAAFATRVALILANADPFPATRRTEEVAAQVLKDSVQGNFLEHHWGRATRVLE
jgi:Zn-dependent M28 family amino/carboxypeptidase